MIAFLTVSSGSQFTTAREFNYPYIMLNFAARLNKRPKHAKVLFVDCGGYYGSLGGNYRNSDESYLEYVQDVHAELFALRDYSCEPLVLQRNRTTVKEQIHKTFEHHTRLIDMFDDFKLTASPVPVLQGYRIDDYLYCLDLFRSHGILSISDYIAVGTLCRRSCAKEVSKIIIRLKDELPAKKLHAFGVKISVLKMPGTYNALYSIDTGAWDFASRWRKLKQGKSRREANREELQSFLSNLALFQQEHRRQQTLTSFSLPCPSSSTAP